MGGWDEEQTLHGHKDWVRDAVWAPNLGMPLNTIASAGQDGQVRFGAKAVVAHLRARAYVARAGRGGWKGAVGS